MTALQFPYREIDIRANHPIAKRPTGLQLLAESLYCAGFLAVFITKSNKSHNYLFLLSLQRCLLIDTYPIASQVVLSLIFYLSNFRKAESSSEDSPHRRRFLTIQNSEDC